MAELRVKSTGTLKLFENDNTSSVTIASPASLGADRTITLPDASVTLASGTMLATDGSGASLTALNASELGSGTVPTARLGSGTASATTFLSGDQTYKEAGGGKVVQMVTARHRGEMSSTSIDSSWYTLADPALAITPTATDNTILIQWYISNHMSGGDQDRSVAFDLERVITDGATTSRLAYTADSNATNGLGYRASNVTKASVGASPYAAGYSTYGGYGQRPYVWADTTYSTTSVCTYKCMAKSYSANAGTYWYGAGSFFIVAVAWEIE